MIKNLQPLSLTLGGTQTKQRLRQSSWCRATQLRTGDSALERGTNRIWNQSENRNFEGATQSSETDPFLTQVAALLLGDGACPAFSWPLRCTACQASVRAALDLSVHSCPLCKTRGTVRQHCLWWHCWPVGNTVNSLIDLQNCVTMFVWNLTDHKKYFKTCYLMCFLQKL